MVIEAILAQILEDPEKYNEFLKLKSLKEIYNFLCKNYGHKGSYTDFLNTRINFDVAEGLRKLNDTDDLEQVVGGKSLKKIQSAVLGLLSLGTLPVSGLPEKQLQHNEVKINKIPVRNWKEKGPVNMHDIGTVSVILGIPLSLLLASIGTKYLVSKKEPKTSEGNKPGPEASEGNKKGEDQSTVNMLLKQLDELEKLTNNLTDTPTDPTRKIFGFWLKLTSIIYVAEYLYVEMDNEKLQLTKANMYTLEKRMLQIVKNFKEVPEQTNYKKYPEKLHTALRDVFIDILSKDVDDLAKLYNVVSAIGEGDDALDGIPTLVHNKLTTLGDVEYPDVSNPISNIANCAHEDAFYGILAENKIDEAIKYLVNNSRFSYNPVY